MAASYPSSVKSFTALNDNASDYPQAAHLNQPYDEIHAIEDALLTTGLAHHIKPSANATYDLGTSALKWRDGYLSRNLTVGGTAGITGAVTLGSTITINGRTYTWPASGTAGRFLEDTDGNGTLAFSSAPTSVISLLKSNSGTTTNAAAENVDTYAVSGLTAKDSLLVVGTWEAVTQQTASLFLYNSTDSKNLDELDAAAAIAAGVTRVFHSTLMQAQSASTLVTARCVAASVSADDTRTSGTSTGYRNTVTTAWTGSWTLALRQGGVTAGGTGKWSWTIYKLAGQ